MAAITVNENDPSNITGVYVGTNLADVFTVEDADDSRVFLWGGGGNDLYLVEETLENYFNGEIRIRENAGAGVDTIRVENEFLGSNYFLFLEDNLENAILHSDEGGSYGYIEGNGLANNISTNSTGDDTITGGVGNDTMAAGEGSDWYYADATADSVVEGVDAGYDYVYSSATYVLPANVEYLELQGTANINGTGNALDNVIYGNDGNNSLSGLAGDDEIYADYGNDTLLGGDGDDHLFGDYGNDNLQGGAGSDYLNGYDGRDTLDGGEGNDEIYGGEGGDADSIQGGGGDDYISAKGGDTVNGGAGNDEIQITIWDDAVANLADGGGAGDDTLYLMNYTDATSYTMHAALENIDVWAGGEGMDVTGNALVNYMRGTDWDDTLRGLGGDDVLFGGEGGDELIGGAGNDSYVVDDLDDEVVELLAGDGAADTVYTALSGYQLGNFVENLTFGGYSGEGPGSNDFMGRGNALNNVILGSGDGDNTLYGMAGNDTLDAMGGEGVLIGGAGNDTYNVGWGDVRVAELANEGTDTVRAEGDYRLGNNVEHLILLSSEGADGIGNSLANSITGGSGSDFLDGGLGNDTLIGGAGNDTYRVNSSADVVTEGAGAGTDNVLASASFTLVSANVENLSLYNGAGNIDGTGNAGNNVIFGNTGRNVLSGLGGNDELHGDRGNDTLLGGDGNDTLDGGTGADNMNGGAGNDLIYRNQSGDVVVAGLGIDTVNSSTSYTLASDAEHLVLSGNAAFGEGNDLANSITGNSSSNTLVGGIGADTLDGGEGNDILDGGAGNDTYKVDSSGDATTDLSGTDIVLSTAGSYTMGTGIEQLTLVEGSDAFSGEGNTSANLMTGNSDDNTLAGGSGNDTLIGNAGNDYLDGGNNVDSMVGGTGNDTYWMDAATDIVVELAGVGTGTDTVHTTFSYTLLGNFENLTLDGVSVINGTGNTLNNFIYGNGEVNVLNGLTGNDTLIGGTGVDTLNGGDGDDVLEGGDDSMAADVLNGGAGNDLYNVYDGDVVADTGGANDIANLYSFSGDGEQAFNAGTAGIEEVRHFGGDGSTGIVGGTANNVIRGFDESTDYTIDGGAGNDLISISAGGESSHLVQGGAGAADSLEIEVDTGIDSANVSIVGVETMTITGEGGLDVVEDNTVHTTNYVLQDYFTGEGEYLSLDVGGLGDDSVTGSENVTVTLRDGNEVELQVDADVGTLTIRSEHSGPETNGIYINDTGNADEIKITGDEALDVYVNSSETVEVENYNGDTLFFGEGDGEGGFVNIGLDNVNTRLVVRDFGTATLDVISASDIVLDVELSPGTLYIDGDADLTLTVENINTSIDAGEAGYLGDLTVYDESGDSFNLYVGYGDVSFFGGEGDNDVYFQLRDIDGNDVLVGGGGDDYVQSDYSLATEQPGTFDIFDFDTVQLLGNGNSLFLNAAGIRGDSTIVLTSGEGGGSGWDVSNLGVDLDADGSNMAVTVEMTGDGQSVTGSDFADYIFGTDNGSDSIAGGDGNDSLVGGTGNDGVYGGNGEDSLEGGDDTDMLAGGFGNDTLTGGEGYDSFVFDSQNEGVDLITDFDVEQDTINLNADGFGVFSGEGGASLYVQYLVNFSSDPGGANEGPDSIGGSDSNDFIKYDTFTGNLYYDSDGSGIGSATHIATLVGAPTITSDDIYLFTPVS